VKGLIFTYLMCYGGAVVSLFRPWYGLLIYVCFAIIKPESLWHWAFQGGGGNFSRIIAIALLVGWAIHGFGNWNLGRSRTTMFALVGFWCWAALSAVVAASNTTVAVHFLEELAKIVLPFVVGVTLIDSEKKVKQLAWVILISQGYVAWELNLSYLSGFNILDGRVGPGNFAGMDNNCVAIAMVTGAGLAFFLGMHEKIWWRKWLAFLCAGLMAHTILFAFSRGGMLALVILGGVTFLLIDKRPRHFAFFGLAVIAGLLLAGPEVRERFALSFADKEHRDASAQSRIDMWNICLRLTGEHPLFGIGPDHFPVHAKSFGLTEGKIAHTLWLQIAAELGVVGLALLLLFYLGTMKKLWPLARRKVPDASEWDVAVARMVIAAFTGFIVSAQFVSLQGLELPYYICLVGAGTLKLRSLRRPALAPQWTPQPAPAYRPRPWTRTQNS
jgi:probable O-glycosylation ligase (exosortase A-associated)